MSIELKQAAEQAVDAFDAFGDADDFASLFELTRKMRALRTAIQQAEAQQPVTGEPLGWLFQHEETGLTQVVDFQQVEWGFEANNPRWQKIRQVYTHPAPSVPDDVVRDAERYRWLRKADRWPCVFPDYFDPEPLAGSELDECVDAAMLAAK